MHDTAKILSGFQKNHSVGFMVLGSFNLTSLILNARPNNQYFQACDNSKIFSQPQSLSL